MPLAMRLPQPNPQIPTVAPVARLFGCFRWQNMHWSPLAQPVLRKLPCHPSPANSIRGLMQSPTPGLPVTATHVMLFGLLRVPNVSQPYELGGLVQVRLNVPARASRGVLVSRLASEMAAPNMQTMLPSQETPPNHGAFK